MKKILILVFVLFGLLSIKAQCARNEQVEEQKAVAMTSFRVMVEFEMEDGKRFMLPYELEYFKEDDKTRVRYGVLIIPKELKKIWVGKYASGEFYCKGSENALGKFIRIFLSDSRFKSVYIVMKPDDK